MTRINVENFTAFFLRNFMISDLIFKSLAYFDLNFFMV